MVARYAEVLGTKPPAPHSGGQRIEIEAATLYFERGKADVIAGFKVALPDTARAIAEARKQRLPVDGNSITICGTRFELQTQ
jgi:hypothetical protein